MPSNYFAKGYKSYANIDDDEDFPLSARKEQKSL